MHKPKHTTLAVLLAFALALSGLFALPMRSYAAPTVVGMGVDRVENGKIVESWGLFDQFGMLQQLGVIPAPGQAEVGR